MDARAIGVFDSGLGGLTVLREIVKLLPFENIVYLGDTARVPYGTRSKETITKFSFQNAEFLLKKNVKCIVIACNTSSAIAAAALKKELKIPVFEVISGASKKAIQVTKNVRVGVIGTRATIASHTYKNKITKLNSKIKVYEKACPLLVPFIEEGEINGKLITQLCRKYLYSFKKQNIDTLVLGCTHYPLIARTIKNVVGKKVKLVSCGKELAETLKSYLSKNSLLNNQSTVGVKKYYVTDLNSRFTIIAEKFLGQNFNKDVQKVEVE
jgi:glutamate racemase